MTTIWFVLDCVVFVIAIAGAIALVRQAIELNVTKAELRAAEKDRDWWRQRAVDEQASVLVKEHHIKRLEEKIKATEEEKKDDERGDRKNPCCGKCVLPVLLQGYECGWEKSDH